MDKTHTFRIVEPDGDSETTSDGSAEAELVVYASKHHHSGSKFAVSLIMRHAWEKDEISCSSLCTHHTQKRCQSRRTATTYDMQMKAGL